MGELQAVLAALFWSVTVILIRISGLSVSAIPLTFFKSFVALACFLLAIPLSGAPLLPELSAYDYGRLVMSGVLGISIADTMFVAALNRLGASLQALADCIYAPALAVVGFLMFGEMLNRWECLGGLCVVGGVALGMSRERTIEKRSLLIGVALAAGAHIVMGVGILMVRDIFREISVIWVCAFRFLTATMVLGVFAAYKGVQDNIVYPFTRRDLWKWMIPMSILGPFIATIFWTGGFAHTSAGRAAIYNQLSTVFIIILARVFLKEKLNQRRLAGVALAAAGAMVVGAH